MNPKSPERLGMRPIDLILFLCGNRGAIERVAATRMAWLIGAILVLTAGIARNYDHLDLLRQSEWFIGPFAASMVSIIFIYLWISGPLKLRQVGPFWRQAGTFLVLAWMTAPCAWLYAIPVESMTDIVTATKWNIAFLAIVAFWRVAIIVRAVSVLTEVSWLRALPLVLAPAALEAMLGSRFQALSLIGIMGGIRLPPETQLLVDAANLTASVSFWLLIALFFLTLMAKGVAKRPLSRPTSPASPALFAVTAVLMLIWTVIAVPQHPRIANRYELQRLIDARDYQAAAAFASAKSRTDFPPHYDIPPQMYPWLPNELLDELSMDAPTWLREEWINRAIASHKEMNTLFQERWQKTIVRYPEIPEAIDRHAAELRSRSKSLSEDEARWLSNYDQQNNPPAPSP
ncbi:MAG: hypothetical protein V4640_09305 [Verrucomicrobiota bacterium]